MGCCPSKRDAATVPPVQLEPQLELEALLAEAVRAGLLDRRSAAETRRRVDAGEVDWHETITTWREILGLDAADHAAAEAFKPLDFFFFFDLPVRGPLEFFRARSNSSSSAQFALALSSDRAS